MNPGPTSQTFYRTPPSTWTEHLRRDCISKEPALEDTDIQISTILQTLTNELAIYLQKHNDLAILTLASEEKVQTILIHDSAWFDDGEQDPDKHAVLSGMWMPSNIFAFNTARAFGKILNPHLPTVKFLIKNVDK